MTEAGDPLPQRLIGQLAATPPLELAAVLLGIGYIALAIRRRRACWILGGLSTALYIVVFVEARLYLQGLLQVAYVGLAVYGWRQWTAAAGVAQIAPRRWPAARHLPAVAAVVAAAAVTAPLLARFTDAAVPWGDALGTWASVVATYLMAQRVAEHWLWWIVIDLGLAGLFASQGLALTALLYAGFAILAVAGYVAWWRAEAASPRPGPQ